MSVEQPMLAIHPWTNHEHIIVFDGVCTFCIATVDFVIARDPQRKFKFGTLQSQTGQGILEQQKLDSNDFETFLYIEKGAVFTKSTAALKVVKGLSGLWPLVYGFIVVPRAIRDLVYQYLARRRYRLMGKQDVCCTSLDSDPNRFV